MSVTEHKLDREDVLVRPWAQKLMKTVEEMSKLAVLRWCSKVIELGEEEIDVDDWTEIYASQVARTLEELHEDVCNLHEKMLDKIKLLLEQLEKLCKDLHVAIPMLDETKSLYKQQSDLQKLIGEYEAKVNIRRRELNDLRDEQMKLCQLLETETMLLSETPLPSPTQMDIFRRYIDKLKSEKSRREEKYKRLKAEIIQLVSDLDIEASLDFEREILSPDSPMDITESNMKQLEIYHQTLVKQANSVREETAKLRSRIGSLWEMLEVDESEREPFQHERFRNCQEELQALKQEFKRLEELKKASIKTFIDKRREELRALWDKCYCGETQKNECYFIDSDSYSEDLLEILDREVGRWTRYYEDTKGIIMKIERHLSLWNQLLELERNAECTDRYKNRGGKLLMEEKARNKLSKKIPELEQNLLESAELFEVKNGQPFKTYGKTVSEYLQGLHDSWEEEKKKRLTSKKQLRDNISGTPAKLAGVSTAHSSVNLKSTPVVAKHNQLPHSGQKKSKRVLGETNCDNASSKRTGAMPQIKFSVLSPARRKSAERKKRIEKGKHCAKRLPLKVSYHGNREASVENYSDINPSDCDASERDCSDKENCENTFVVSDNSTFQSHSNHGLNEVTKPVRLPDLNAPR